jgi:hypothetical protein
MNTFPPPVNPDDPGYGPMEMGLAWTFTVFAMVAVGLRAYVRQSLAKRLSSDDWLMCLALVFHLISMGFVSTGYHYGLGKHDADLTMDQMGNVLKWSWLANTPGLLVSITARLSIAILLVRLFGVHEWFKWFVIVVTAACSIMTIVIIPCTYLQTTPVSGNWNPFDPSVTRWNPKIYITMAFVGQSFITFSDLTFVLFPVIIIWRLRMALTQRVALIFLLGVSLFTMVMSILKTIGLQTIADQQNDPSAKDVLYNASLQILWSCLEQACVIIMGCVPPLRALMRLESTRALSASLNSLLRRAKPSQASSSKPYKHSGSGYADLEMRPDQLGRSNGSSAVAMHEQGAWDSQRDLVKNNGMIMQANEFTVSYSHRHDGGV